MGLAEEGYAHLVAVSQVLSYFENQIPAGEHATTMDPRESMHLVSVSQVLSYFEKLLKIQRGEDGLLVRARVGEQFGVDRRQRALAVLTKKGGHSASRAARHTEYI